jgi:hypothetical protein
VIQRHLRPFCVARRLLCAGHARVPFRRFSRFPRVEVSPLHLRACPRLRLWRSRRAVRQRREHRWQQQRQLGRRRRQHVHVGRLVEPEPRSANRRRHLHERHHPLHRGKLRLLSLPGRVGGNEGVSSRPHLCRVHVRRRRAAAAALLVSPHAQSSRLPGHVLARVPGTAVRHAEPRVQLPRRGRRRRERLCVDGRPPVPRRSGRRDVLGRDAVNRWVAPRVEPLSASARGSLGPLRRVRGSRRACARRCVDGGAGSVLRRACRRSPRACRTPR